MNNYKQIQAPFKSEPSTVLILEDEKTKEKSYCFAVHKCLKQFFDEEQKMLADIAQTPNIRNYVKQITEKETVYLYFYKYVDGQTMYQQIANNKVKHESISQETITQYFFQLIETLYQLHNKKILGRVFTTENIIIADGNIILMDFGYGADLLNLRKSMLNPPEIAKGVYSLQLDVWLLGAVLYHLTKLSPINLSVYVQDQPQVAVNQDQAQSALLSSCSSKRYGEEFTGLIQQMLVLDQEKRISFKKILEHKFCQKFMEKKQREKYLKFYNNLETNHPYWFNEFVIKREQINMLNNTDFLLQTAQDLQKQHPLINQLYLNYRDLPQKSQVNDLEPEISKNSSRCQLEVQGSIVESKIIANERPKNSSFINNHYFNNLIHCYHPEKKDQISRRIHMYFYKVYLIQSFGEEEKIGDFLDKNLYNFLFNKLRYMLLVEFEIALKGQITLSTDPFYQSQEWLYYVKFEDRKPLFTIIEKLRTQAFKDSELARNALSMNKTIQKYQQILPTIEKECKIQSNADERQSLQYLKQVIRPLTNYLYINMKELQQKTKNIQYCYLACIVTFIHSINRACEIDFLEKLQQSLRLNSALYDFTDAENFHQYLINQDRRESDFANIIENIHSMIFFTIMMRKQLNNQIYLLLQLFKMIQGYPQYKQKIVMLITWSGRIILIEEAINNNTNKQYFGLEPPALFDMNFLQEDEINHPQNQAELKKAKIFRTYEKMVTIQKEIYLFNYVEAYQVEKRIIEYRNQKKSLPKKLINDLLGQLLDALYQLHKLNMLGRQFSTTNVLEDKNNKIFLMDFGFGPDFYHPDNLILHPPEIVTQLYLRTEKNMSRFDETKLYDTKLDSWLLGAFIYNLIRLRPITQHKYPNLTDYYLELLKLQENNQTCISAKTPRYEGEGICEFIEKLLVFNPQHRLSFLQIHQSDYVKNLNLPKHSIYEKYYQEHENNRALLLKILKRETAQSSKLFETFDFKPPESAIHSQELNTFQQKIPSNLPISSNVQSVEIITQSNQGGENEIRYTEEEMNKDITKKFYYHANDIKNSKYYAIWEYINMEQYRCYMLNNTSEVVVLHLDQKFELQDLTSYFLKKMSFLILSELLANLKKEKCPWKVQQELWKQFHEENKKKTLEATLIIAFVEKEKELKEIGQKVYQKYINNSMLDAGIKNSLQTDYLSQFNFSQYSSDQFIKQGFRLVTTNLHKYLCQESNVYDEMRVNYYGLILKAVFCHLINRALNYDSINEQFLSLKPKNPDERLTPNDIDEFIHSKENDKPKIKQINFLMNKYFAKE